jgi:hypothetical protein
MKFVKLEVMCLTEQAPLNSYKEVLKELNLQPEETEDTTWLPMWFNIKTLEDELYCVSARKVNPEHTIMELYDTRTFIVKDTVENIVSLLNDTQTI